MVFRRLSSVRERELFAKPGYSHHALRADQDFFFLASTTVVDGDEDTELAKGRNVFKAISRLATLAGVGANLMIDWLNGASDGLWVANNPPFPESIDSVDEE